MANIPKLPDIPEEQRTPLVTQLLEVIRYQMEVIQGLRDEIAVLKGNKPRPKIKPGKMEKESNKDKKSAEGKRPGSIKKSKTDQLPIHETISIAAGNVPQGSEFKGYKEFIVQGLIIRAHNIRYLMERWQTPEGSYVQGKLPSTVHGHFSSELISYILYQYYQCHVTQPLVREQLHELGIHISSGQINKILGEGHDDFHKEKDAILTIGLQVSSHINVDDTGARHKGKNGVCTHIGNELFAFFKSTESKSRINFLELLRAGHKDYHITREALDYMEAQKLPKRQLHILHEDSTKILPNEEQWQYHLRWALHKSVIVRLPPKELFLEAFYNRALTQTW